MPEPLLIQGTPEQIAIILLDISLRSQLDHSVLNGGLANLLRRLREELLPDTLPLAAKQAAVAAPALDETAMQTMDAEQRSILNKAFDFIKANNPDAAVKAVRDYIKSTKPEVITNYIYFLKLLRLLFHAFNVLADRRGELNSQVTPEDQYCFKVIGLAIEMAFGERMRQQLENGIGNFLYNHRVAPRKLVNAVKSNSSFFRNQAYDYLILGDSAYFGEYGRAGGGGPWLRPGRAKFLYHAMQQLHQQCRIFTSITEPTRMQDPDASLDPRSTATPKLAGP